MVKTLILIDKKLYNCSIDDKYITIKVSEDEDVEFFYDWFMIPGPIKKDYCRDIIHIHNKLTSKCSLLKDVFPISIEMGFYETKVVLIYEREVLMKTRNMYYI